MPDATTQGPRRKRQRCREKGRYTIKSGQNPDLNRTTSVGKNNQKFPRSFAGVLRRCGLLCGYALLGYAYSGRDVAHRARAGKNGWVPTLRGSDQNSGFARIPFSLFGKWQMAKTLLLKI